MWTRGWGVIKALNNWRGSRGSFSDESCFDNRCYFYIAFCKCFSRQTGSLAVLLIVDHGRGCVTEQHYVSIFFTLLLSVHCYAFQVGRLLTSRRTYNFFCLRFIFASRLVLYSCTCTVENPEISGFCVLTIRAVPTDHKPVRNVVLFCNTDKKESILGK